MLRGWHAVCGVRSVKVDAAEAREDAVSSRHSQSAADGLPEDFRDHSFDLVADIDQHPMRVKWIRQLMVALEAHAEPWGPTAAEFESMVIGHATRAKSMMTPQQTYFTLMHMTEILSDAGKVRSCVCVREREKNKIKAPRKHRGPLAGKETSSRRPALDLRERDIT
jgi:hypothetical protein